MTSLLRLDEATLKFGGLTALSQVSLTINQDGIHGIIGPNGAGKSTLFNLVTGIYKPTSGQLTLDDIDLGKLTTPDIANLGIARTFQNIRLLPQLSVFDNLCVAAAAMRSGTFWQSLLGLPSAKQSTQAIQNNAKELLAMIGLSKVSKHYPQSLPYGDQRKLEIARALMRRPKLLLLDEPAAGMNPIEKKSLERMIKNIAAQQITVVVIEHDMRFVMNLCHHITVLNQGMICAQGTPIQIQQDPHVIEIYLGQKALN